jgi:hypothetical protein
VRLLFIAVFQSDSPANQWMVNHCGFDSPQLAAGDLLYVFLCLDPLVTRPFSFDHLVCPEQHRLRNRQPDLLSRLQIEH